MEIRVPLPAVLGEELINEKAGTEVGQYVSLGHGCI